MLTDRRLSKNPPENTKNHVFVAFPAIKNDWWVVWPRELVRYEALIQAHLLDTSQMCVRPLEKILRPSEVQTFE